MADAGRGGAESAGALGEACARVFVRAFLPLPPRLTSPPPISGRLCPPPDQGRLECRDGWQAGVPGPPRRPPAPAPSPAPVSPRQARRPRQSGSPGPNRKGGTLPLPLPLLLLLLLPGCQAWWGVPPWRPHPGPAPPRTRRRHACSSPGSVPRRVRPRAQAGKGWGSGALG